MKNEKNANVCHFANMPKDVVKLVFSFYSNSLFLNKFTCVRKALICSLVLPINSASIAVENELCIKSRGLLLTAC